MSMTPSNDTSGKLIDQASQSADHAIRATQQAANQAVDSAGNALQDLRKQTTPVLERASEQVSAMAHRGLDSVRETSHQLRLKAEHASDSTVGYIRQEPVKAVLIAAATGAALMALVSLVARSRHHD
ncbi:hypothetical protein [Rhodoferax sp. U11-2br]|uniref:hypothetical protein n=1 Tax=Rhodoferax sp. U11-2br TaxID=2838878 RepID=UPI001BE7C285|nr:hypothetical protein [Rhodoferax sp. U11-2br]MBT3067530.1 hypothetical protein [Rhodoferax sp. U11-2br]